MSRAAVRLPVGRGPPRLRHRRDAQDPRRLPRLRRAQHLLRQHGPVHQPPRVAGQGDGPLEGQARRQDAVHLIQKTGWPRFLLETALARPGRAHFVPVLQALQARGARARAPRRHGSRRLESPLPRAARRRAPGRRGRILRPLRAALRATRRLLLSGVLFRRAGDAHARPAWASPTTAMRSAASRAVPRPTDESSGTGPSR